MQGSVEIAAHRPRFRVIDTNAGGQRADRALLLSQAQPTTRVYLMSWSDLDSSGSPGSAGPGPDQQARFVREPEGLVQAKRPSGPRSRKALL